MLAYCNTYAYRYLPPPPGCGSRLFALGEYESLMHFVAGCCGGGTIHSVPVIESGVLTCAYGGDDGYESGGAGLRVSSSFLAGSWWMLFVGQGIVV